MAYDTEKLVKLKHLQAMAQATKEELDRKVDAGGTVSGDVATDEEVAEMLGEIFGAAEEEPAT